MPQDPIDALCGLLEERSLRLEVLPENADLARHDLREIRLHVGDESVVLPVFDEFRDSDLPSQVVRLHLLLDACECFEEAADASTWRSDLGLPKEPIVEAAYRRLAIGVPQVRAWIGRDVRAINAHDIEFGTTLATRLRSTLD